MKYHNLFSKFAIAALAFSTMYSFTTKDASADVIDVIKARGKLVVGSKADYKPYGYRDTSGAIVGIEPTLAQAVATKLGVELEVVPVVSSNRMQFLQQGKIDLMIATMTDKPDRRKIVYAVDPNYYSSGVNIMAWKKAALKNWEDLRGRNICSIQGVFFNKKIAQDFGAKISAFKGSAESLTALGQGNCVAFIYDDSFIAAKLQEVEFNSKYEMPLPTIDDAPWSVAVRNGEDRFNKLVSEMIIDWHKSGYILELETKYGLNNSQFAIRMHEEYK